MTAALAAMLLAFGMGTALADTSTANRRLPCGPVVDHVPGRMDKVWVIRCEPGHSVILRY